MSRPLPYANKKVTWRMRADDIAYLNAVFDGNRVNDVVRDLVHLYVERMKARAKPTALDMAHLYADNGIGTQPEGE